MIYWDLFVGFLQVGCFAFGGAYGAIPLIRDVVLSYGWLTDETLAYMIAVAESTPGPIMINLATYVGSSQAGIVGSIFATLAVVLPSFIVIIVLTAALKTAMKNKYVQAVIRGMKPCIIGIVLATGVYMIGNNVLTSTVGTMLNVRALILTVLLLAITYGAKPILKKKPSPIMLIVISALLGVVVYGV